MQSNIEVKFIDNIQTIGTSCIGVQNLSSTFQNVLEWAEPKGLLRKPNFKMATIYYDSFKTTAPDKVRMRACLLVDEPLATDADMTFVTINKGNHIMAHHEINTGEFERVWTELFIWMNTNGYSMRNEPPFEIYHNDFNTLQRRSVLWICIYRWSKNTKKSVFKIPKNKSQIPNSNENCPRIKL